MRYVVGVDCGGTKSVALAVDQRGELLAQSRGAGANPMVDDRSALTATLRELLGPLQLERRPPEALCLGISGAGRDRERALVEDSVRALEISTRLQIVHDAEIALHAGSTSGIGLALIAGTGSMSYGRDRSGAVARCGGWGYLLGDEGSATWLVRESLRRSLRAFDGRGPATCLGDLFAEELRLDHPQGLVRWVYEEPRRRDRFAVLLPVVTRAAAAADAVALAVIEAGAVALTELAAATVPRLDLGADDRTVLAGGAFLGCPPLAERVCELLKEHATTAKLPVARLGVEPAWGAVRLALNSCGLMDQLQG